MTIKQVLTEAISSTGAQFLVDEFSVGGVLSVVPYSKIMGGAASSTAVAGVSSDGRLQVETAGAVDISNTASVIITGSLPAGTNSIGKVDLSATANVIIAAAIPAGTNSIGKVDVSNTASVQIVNALPSGTNSIGRVDISATASVIITQPIPTGTNSIGAVDVSNTASVQVVNALPAGTNSIGKVDISATANVNVVNQPSVIAAIDGASIYDSTTALTPKFANYGILTSGATTILSAVAAKKLRVVAMAVVSEGAAGMYVQDNDSHILMGTSADPMEFQAGGGMVLPYSPVGWFETTASGSLQFVPDTATSIAGSIVYVEI